MKIDIHVHLVSLNTQTGAFLSPGAISDPALRRLLNSRLAIPSLTHNIEQTFDNWYIQTLARKIRDSKHIDRAVLLAYDLAYTPSGHPDTARSLAHTPNNLVLDAAKKHPGEFLPGVSINPYRKDAVEELHRCAALGAVLVKWVPNSQNINPADKQIAPFYDKMAGLKIPLLSHTGYEHALRAHDQTLGDPARLQLPLDRGVTVIAAHAGASGDGHPVEYFDNFLLMLHKHPNLYGDISALTWTNRSKYLRRMLREPHIFDKMLQGSDYPVPVVPAVFARELGLAKSLAMQPGNYFDVDANLKLSLGVPQSVFTRASTILPL